MNKNVMQIVLLFPKCLALCVLFMDNWGTNIPESYSTRTTYGLPLFDRYVLRTSAIRQVRTKNPIFSATWHMQKCESSKPLLGLRLGVNPDPGINIMFNNYKDAILAFIIL